MWQFLKWHTPCCIGTPIHYNKGIRGGGYHRRRKSSTLPLPYFFFKISEKKTPCGVGWFVLDCFRYHFVHFFNVCFAPVCSIWGCEWSDHRLHFIKEVCVVSALFGDAVVTFIIVNPKSNVPSCPIWPSIVFFFNVWEIEFGLRKVQWGCLLMYLL